MSRKALRLLVVALLVAAVVVPASLAGAVTSADCWKDTYDPIGDGAFDEHIVPNPFTTFDAAGRAVFTGTSGDDEVFVDYDNPFPTYVMLGDGHDRFCGGPFKDVVWGQSGDDELWGLNGDDKLYGGPGFDRLYGGRGNDKLRGNADNDYIEGGSGDDQIWGKAGNDDARGMDGDDLIRGGDGDDWLCGGGDGDCFVGDYFNGVDDARAIGCGVRIFNETDTRIPDPDEYDDDNDKVAGGAGYDCVAGGFGSDEVFGGSGDDCVTGGSWGGLIPADARQVNGNGVNGFCPPGYDRPATLADDNDLVKGGDGDDHLWGDMGDDELWGGDGDDDMYGGQGDDYYNCGSTPIGLDEDNISDDQYGWLIGGGFDTSENDCGPVFDFGADNDADLQLA